MRKTPIMNRILCGCFGLFLTLTLAPGAHAAYVLAIDIDGVDDVSITYNPLFSFGGDTTTASTSIKSTAFGMPTGNSIFGGDGSSSPDTYVFTYNPGVNGDNLVLAPGQPLGNGNFASGITAGGTGLYNVYATWPFTFNVSGGDTLYETVTSGSSDSRSINQNGPFDAGLGNVWVLVGQVQYTSGAITVTQAAGTNTFVSMRAAGLLFEPVRQDAVPEPSTYLLVGLGLFGVFLRRRRFAAGFASNTRAGTAGAGSNR